MAVGLKVNFVFLNIRELVFTSAVTQAPTLNVHEPLGEKLTDRVSEHLN